jgi:hypothetical protein
MREFPAALVQGFRESRDPSTIAVRSANDNFAQDDN